MKTRNGFVSNSSSSSFIITLPVSSDYKFTVSFTDRSKRKGLKDKQRLDAHRWDSEEKAYNEKGVARVRISDKVCAFTFNERLYLTLDEVDEGLKAYAFSYEEAYRAFCGLGLLARDVTEEDLL